MIKKLVSRCEEGWSWGRSWHVSPPSCLWAAVPFPFLVTLLFIFIILTREVGEGRVVGSVQ